MFPGIISPIVGVQLFVFEPMPGIVMSIWYRNGQSPVAGNIVALTPTIRVKINGFLLKSLETPSNMLFLQRGNNLFGS